MGTGKTYSTKYLLDSNNNRGAVGQVLSTTSTGIDWVNANTVPGAGLWLANGNDIYNSNSGNVGIGTTSPDAKLEIEGDVDNSFYSVFVKNTNAGSDAFVSKKWWNDETGANFGEIWRNSSTRTSAGQGIRSFNMYNSHDINFWSGGTHTMALVGSDVGIGTDSPSQKLEVQGTILVNNEIQFVDGNMRIFRSTNDMKFRTAATDRMTILGTGDVCIGTSTPSSNNNYGTGDLNVENDVFASAQIFTHNDTAGNFSFLGLGKSSGTGALPTIVQTDERIAVVGFYGYDGAAYKRFATIDARIDGTPAAGDMPGKLEFGTAASGTSSPTIRMVIDNAGDIRFNAYGAGTLRSDASGNITAYGGTTPVSGSGTLRTIPMWSPDGTTLGNSVLKQDVANQNIGLGITPETGMVTYVAQLRIGEQSALQGHIDGVGQDSFTCVTTNCKFTTSGPAFINGTVAAPGFANLYQQQLGDHSFNCSTTSGVTDAVFTQRSQMVIKQSGKVGIGATAPLAPLHVVTPPVPNIDLTDISRTADNLVRFTNPQYSTNSSMGLLLRVFPDSDSRQGAGLLMTGGSDNSASNLSLFVSKDDGSGNSVSTSYSALHIAGNTADVGIGTTSPAARLDVVESVVDVIPNGSSSAVFRRNGDNYISILSSTAGEGGVLFGNSSDAVDGWLVYKNGSGNQYMSIGTADADRVRIDAAGRVGIGTTTATEKLQVDGNIFAEQNIIDGDVNNPSPNLLAQSDIKISNQNDIYNNLVKVVISPYEAAYTSAGTGASTIRLDTQSAMTPGATHTFSVYYKDLIGSLGIDLYDQTAIGSHTAATGTAAAPASGRLYGFAQKATTAPGNGYNFLDINLTNNGSVTLLNPKVETGKVPTEFIVTTEEEGISQTLTINNIIATGKIEITKDLVLGTESSIVLDDQPLDNTASGSGTIVNWSVASATTAGQVYSIKADGGWAIVTSSGFQATLMLGWSLGTTATQGILLQGFLYKSSHGLTIGAPIYIGGSQGALTNTAPTTAGHFVRIIGYATSVDNIYFDPDKTWIELT